ncbi:MAG: hypothetical protein WCG75_01650, partial [Armatimonadota bacterium]
MRSFLVGLLCTITCLLVGCGGSGAAPSGTVNNVSISPNPVHLKPTQKVQLTAILDGGSAPITWSINTPNGGTILQTGEYTAPSTSGTYVVQVALTSNPAKFGTANAIVDSGYFLSISSANSPSGPFFIPFNGTLQLSAKVNGASSNDVTWVTDYGSISSTGLLSAPGTAGTAHVTATSVSDPGKSITIPVGVVPPIVIVNGSDTKLALPRSRYTFTAKVSGVVSTNVDWSADTGT